MDFGSETQQRPDYAEEIRQMLPRLTYEELLVCMEHMAEEKRRKKAERRRELDAYVQTESRKYGLDVKLQDSVPRGRPRRKK